MMNWDDVEIRPFDKTKGFVIVDEAAYVASMHEELSNTNVYEKIADGPGIVVDINNRIRAWADEWEYQQQISSNIAKWVVNPNATAGYFYKTYKAHKPPLYPTRTITSACGSPTERLSQWLDYFLSPIARSLEHQIEDTNDILRKIKTLNESGQLVGKNIIHVTWDITAMFPNIDNEKGMNACKKRLEEREVKYPCTQCIMEALEISLTQNIASFDGVVHRQRSGAAMGPAHSCAYADDAVDEIIDRVVCDPSKNLLYVLLAIWARYRDDIYAPWIGSESDLIAFNVWLNTIDPALKFEMKYDINAGGVEFLDLYLFTRDGAIESRVYSKPCDPHAYLLPSSCHPYHICNNIPIGVFKRLKRCCSASVDYDQAVVEYTEYLSNREYSDATIEKAIERVKSVERRVLISKNLDTEDKNKKFFPLTIKFNPKLPNMSKIINKHKHILSLNPETNSIFPANSILVTYKNERNINSLLTTNKFKSKNTRNENETPSNSNTQGGCKSCNKCSLCKHFLREGDTVLSYHTEQTYKIRSTITCQTAGVIYIIYDKICRKNYVGFSRNDMRERWANHKSHIKKQWKGCKLATHFAEHRNNKHKIDTTTQAKYTECLKQQIEVMFIECVDPNLNSNNIDKTLLEREAYFQSFLKATVPFGGLCRRDTRRELLNNNNRNPFIF